MSLVFKYAKGLDTETMSTQGKVDLGHRWPGATVPAVGALLVVCALAMPAAANRQLTEMQEQLTRMQEQVRTLQTETLDTSEAVRRDLADTFERLSGDLKEIADKQTRALASLSRLAEHLQRIDQQLASLEKRVGDQEDYSTKLAEQVKAQAGSLSSLRKEIEANHEAVSKVLKKTVDDTNQAIRQMQQQLGGQSSAPAATGAATDDRSTSIAGTYVIQSGDTLTAIARSFNIRVDALMQANRITDPNAIRVGQELKIPESSNE